MTHYRIKTKEEFGGCRPTHWNSIGEMDYLYGLYIGTEHTIYIDRWILNEEDIIEMKEREPQNVRKIKRKLDRINARFGIKVELSEEQWAEIKTDNAKDLANAFIWKNTKEGHRYWEVINQLYWLV